MQMKHLDLGFLFSSLFSERNIKNSTYLFFILRKGNTSTSMTDNKTYFPTMLWLVKESGEAREGVWGRNNLFVFQSHVKQR